MPIIALICFVIGVVFEGSLLIIQISQVQIESFMFAVILYGIVKVFYMEILKYQKKKVPYKGLVELLQSFCLGMFIPNITALMVLCFYLSAQNRVEQGFVLFVAGLIFSSFMFKNTKQVNFKGS